MVHSLDFGAKIWFGWPMILASKVEKKIFIKKGHIACTDIKR